MAEITRGNQATEPWGSIWSRAEDLGTLIAILFFVGLAGYAISRGPGIDGFSRIHIVAAANSVAGGLIAASRLAAYRNPRWLQGTFVGFAVLVLVASAAQFWFTR